MNRKARPVRLENVKNLRGLREYRNGKTLLLTVEKDVTENRRRQGVKSRDFKEGGTSKGGGVAGGNGLEPDQTYWTETQGFRGRDGEIRM